MVWTAVDDDPLLLKTNWQYTEPVEGVYFKLKHSNFPASNSYLVAQAQVNLDGSIELSDIRELRASDEAEVLLLKPPPVFTDRRIAIKRIAKQPNLASELRRVVRNDLLQDSEDEFIGRRSTWSVDIEVSNYVVPVVSGDPTPDPPSETESSPLTIFGADLICWYRADEVVAASGLVSQWTDKSGKNNHASQPTAALQPSLVSNGFNSKPVIRFNNTDVWFSMPNCLDPVWGEASLFVVYKLNDINQFWNAVTTGSGIDSFWGTNQSFNYAGFISEFRTSRIDSQPPNMTVAGQHFIEILSGVGTNTYKLFRDGANLLTTNPAWGVTNAPKIGKGLNASLMNGDIAEIFIVKKAATDAQRLQAQDYVKSFWNLTF